MQMLGVEPRVRTLGHGPAASLPALACCSRMSTTLRKHGIRHTVATVGCDLNAPYPSNRLPRHFATDGDRPESLYQPPPTVVPTAAAIPVQGPGLRPGSTGAEQPYCSHVRWTVPLTPREGTGVVLMPMSVSSAWSHGPAGSHSLLCLLVRYSIMLTCLSSDSCVDSPPNWKDSGGDNCAAYRSLKYCTPRGEPGNGWLPGLGTFAQYARDGKDASQACCACGGGDRGTSSSSSACFLPQL